jgi:hypothetical protein
MDTKAFQKHKWSCLRSIHAFPPSLIRCYITFPFSPPFLLPTVFLHFFLFFCLSLLRPLFLSLLFTFLLLYFGSILFPSPPFVYFFPIIHSADIPFTFLLIAFISVRDISSRTIPDDTARHKISRTGNYKYSNITYLVNTQNYWIFGLRSSSGILETRKHNVSETGSVSILRWVGRQYSVGSPRNS